MTTLYRFGILACLITIAYAVWKIAHAERVTSVAPDVPTKRENQAVPSRFHHDPLGLASFDERQKIIDSEIRLEK